LPLTDTPVPPLTDTPTPEPPYPGLAGRVVFTRRPSGHQDNDREIYLLELDTGNLSRLTSNSVADWDPNWSPDGTSIAFVSFLSGNNDLWIMNADGSGQTRRIALEAWDDYPTWSPDGSRMAFVSTGVTEGMPNSEVFVGSSTGDVRQVTINTGRDEWPSWAPDGRWLACSSDRDGDMDIYLFTSDGGDVVHWTDDPAFDEQPAWSPDGEWIAFTRKTEDTDGDGLLERRDDGDFGDLWIGRRDGSEFHRLTYDSRAADPAWSPDGRHVVFAHFHDTTGDELVGLGDGSDLWVIPVSGGDPIALTEGPEQDWTPDWTW
jgi:Tol biopolymer transport system component